MAAAHTFLKKNPDDSKLTKNMNYYKSLLDVEEYLIDHEEQPYEVRIPTPPLPPWRLHRTHLVTFVFQSVFLKSVTLYNSGDFSSSARNMEEALVQYFEIYQNCLAGCEGSYEILEFKDFYPTLAGKNQASSRLAPLPTCSPHLHLLPQISTRMFWTVRSDVRRT